MGLGHGHPWEQTITWWILETWATFCFSSVIRQAFLDLSDIALYSFPRAFSFNLLLSLGCKRSIGQAPSSSTSSSLKTSLNVASFELLHFRILVWPRFFALSALPPLPGDKQMRKHLSQDISIEKGRRLIDSAPILQLQQTVVLELSWLPILSHHRSDSCKLLSMPVMSLYSCSQKLQSYSPCFFLSLNIFSSSF